MIDTREVIAQALQSYRAPARLLLAVSGGPDSMALLHLVADWATTLPTNTAPALAVATVDHGLRVGSRDEAALVAAAANAYGLPHAVLTWTGAKPSTRLQERAREARYELLVAHADAMGACAILTGHHADDQAETVLMRIGRGSGVAGVAGMRPVYSISPSVALVRPLLAITKNRLLQLCRDHAIAWVSDPSNSDPRFARTRLRAQADTAAALGLDAATLGRLACRVARADDALAFAARQFEARVAPIVTDKSWSAETGVLTGVPVELVQRLLRSAIEHVGGRSGSPVRLDRLEALADSVVTELEGDGRLSATLGRTRILVEDGRLVVTREKQRRRGRGESRGTAIKAELTRRPVRLGKEKRDAYIGPVFTAGFCSEKSNSV